MARRKRSIESGKVYEICFRARRGLPFIPLKAVNLLLESAIARAQRDSKVTLCNMEWLGNHVHMLVVLKDANDSKNFCQEVKKKVTEYIKRLLGKRYLSLWELDSQVSVVLDVEKVKQRIAYTYLNPAAANLAMSVTQYPGVSSWEAFSQSTNTVDYVHKKECPWIRFPQVKRLRKRRLSTAEDEALERELIEGSTITHTLEIHPNAWMKAFKIEAPEEIGRINTSIKAEIAAKEDEYHKVRTKAGISVIGPKHLRRLEIMRAHTPKKRERINFVLSSVPELRIAYIARVKALFKWCSVLYERACKGEAVTWPPGVFPVASRVLCNAIG